MMNIGVQGIQAGLKGMKRAAQDVAELNVDKEVARPDSGQGASTETHKDVVDTTTAAIDLKTHARQVQASAKVVETADQVIGFLLDIQA